MKFNMNKAEKSVMEDLVSGSNVMSEEEYRNLILAISEYSCSIVTKTLGPYGKTTNVDDGTFTAPTKDGWTVLRNLRFADALYNSLYNVVNQSSFDLVTKVGDGTTSALTGANVFLHAILEEMENANSPLYRMRQSDLLDIIENVKDTIVEKLSHSAEIRHINPDGDFEDIYKIALVSSNGNEELARQIQYLYQQTKNPNIFVSLDSGDKIVTEIQDGYKYDGYVLNQACYRNHEDRNYHIDEPVLVAIFDHNVTYNEHSKIVSALSNYATAHNTSVIIVAPYFDDIMTNILNTSIQSFVQQGKVPNIVLMQVPLANTADRLAMKDFTLLTNAQVFDYGKVRAVNVFIHNSDPKNIKNKIEDELLDIKQYQFESVEELVDTCIGHINEAVLGEKYLLLKRYDTVVNKELYQQTLYEIENEFIEIARRTNKSSNMLTKDYLGAQQRYIKMLGKMGTIKVGGQTELEKHCMKDWVDDSVLACRSAFNNGYIRGLNLTTLSVIKNMITDTTTNLNIDAVIGKDLEGYNKNLAVLNLFYEVFLEMSLTVLRNKYPDMVGVNAETNKEETTEVVYQVYEKVDGVESASEYTNSKLMNYCIPSNKTFDLITNTINEDWVIINSLATDVEILNSIVGVLSIFLTSDQYISLNKGYDKKMSRKLILEKEQDKAKAIEYGRLQARLDFYREACPDVPMKKAILHVLNSNPFGYDS